MQLLSAVRCLSKMHTSIGKWAQPLAHCMRMPVSEQKSPLHIWNAFVYAQTIFAQIRNSMSCRFCKSDSNNEWKYDKFTSIHCSVGNATTTSITHHCAKINWMDLNEEADKLNRKWRAIETHIQFAIPEMANERNCSIGIFPISKREKTSSNCLFTVTQRWIHCHLVSDLCAHCTVCTRYCYYLDFKHFSHSHKTIIISFSVHFDHMQCM